MAFGEVERISADQRLVFSFNPRVSSSVARPPSRTTGVEVLDRNCVNELSINAIGFGVVRDSAGSILFDECAQAFATVSQLLH